MKLFNILYTSLILNLFISIRYPKLLTKVDFEIKPIKLNIGSWETLNQGKKVCILAVGSMVETSLKSLDILKTVYSIDITLINCRFIKPLDEDLLNMLIVDHQCFITIEEGILSGGFGSSIAQFFIKNNINRKLKNLGIDDKFTEHGSRKELLKDLYLDEKSITLLIKSLYEE